MHIQKKTILLSIFFAMLFIGLSRFVFWGDALSFILALVPGFAFVILGEWKKTTEFIPSLLVGSIIFAFLGLLLNASITMYLTEGSLYLIKSWDSYWLEVLKAACVFCIISLLGGLVGFAIKGAYLLVSRKNV